MKRRAITILVSALLALSAAGSALASQPPGLRGYEGQPANQGGGSGQPPGLLGYEGQPANQGGH